MENNNPSIRKISSLPQLVVSSTTTTTVVSTMKSNNIAKSNKTLMPPPSKPRKSVSNGVVKAAVAAKPKMPVHSPLPISVRLRDILNTLPATPKARTFVQCNLSRHVISTQECEALIEGFIHYAALYYSEEKPLTTEINGSPASVAMQQQLITTQDKDDMLRKLLSVDWPLITTATAMNDDAGKNYADELDEKLFRHARLTICQIIAHNNRLSNVAFYHIVSMFRRYRATELSTTTSDNYEAAFDLQYFTRVHALLDATCLAVPLNADLITICISQTYPYRSKPACEHYNYIRNLLMFADRYPRYRRDVLGTIIQELNDIDHVTPAQAIREAELRRKNPTTGVTGEKIMAFPLAETLNISMHLLFDHISSRNVTDMSTYYRDCFQPLFESIVLRSHYIHHIQYLWFYLAACDSAIRNEFLEYLWNKFTSPSSSAVLRQCAVHYLCSMLARNSAIDTDTVLLWLIKLLKWCENYVVDFVKHLVSSLGDGGIAFEDGWASSSSSSNSGDSGIGDAGAGAKNDSLCAHAVFFAASHMSLYLLCFRSGELFTSRKARAYIFDRAPLRAIVYSTLNPLRFCSPVVVEFFADVCRRFHIMLLHPLIQENSRSSSGAEIYSPVDEVEDDDEDEENCDVLAIKNDAEAVDSHTKQSRRLLQQLKRPQTSVMRRVYSLVHFFPFEPYMLKRDQKLIAPYYKLFEGLASTTTVSAKSDDEDDFVEQKSSPLRQVEEKLAVVVDCLANQQKKLSEDEEEEKPKRNSLKRKQQQQLRSPPAAAVSASAATASTKLLQLAQRRSSKKLKRR